MHPINLNWPHYIERYISQGKHDYSSHQPQREGINLKYFPAQRQLSSFLISRSISDDCFLACEAKKAKLGNGDGFPPNGDTVR